MELQGLIDYGVFFVTFAGIYAILALGLNVQWGYTGLFNIGVAAFWGVGSYTTAIFTSPPNDAYLGGFALPVVVGWVAAMVTSGILAFLVGIVTLRLREDYLAIASIGIAEIVRLVFKNEAWLTNGVRGIAGVPRPLERWLGSSGQLFWIYLVVVVALVALLYWLLERARRSPWGRVLRAVREDEAAAAACGKSVVSFRLQAFVAGSMIMGLGGAVYANFVGFVSPEAFDPMYATFLVWVMLIAGGSGNNRGAILGCFIIWVIWSGTELLINLYLPPELLARGSALRLLLVGVLLEVILLTRPAGLLPEPRSGDR